MRSGSRTPPLRAPWPVPLFSLPICRKADISGDQLYQYAARLISVVTNCINCCRSDISGDQLQPAGAAAGGDGRTRSAAGLGGSGAPAARPLSRRRSADQRRTGSRQVSHGQDGLLLQASSCQSQAGLVRALPGYLYSVSLTLILLPAI